MKAYVNGQFVPLESAAISVHDAAVQHAVGLFETMQAFNGKVFRLEAHIARLIDSAQELGLASSLRQDALCELVESTLKENDAVEARLRLTVTGGDLSLLGAARAGGESPAHQPGIVCVATAPTQYPPAFFEQGVTAVIADPKANPFDPGAGHKTLNYWARLRTLADAAQAGAGEAIWMTITNHIAGGAVSNLFIVKDGTLFTPFARGEEGGGPIPWPVLPGVTRAAIIESAEQYDIPFQRQALTINELLEADEVFLTNSSWQVLPVTAIERHPIADQAVGPVTTKLRDAILDRIAKETT